MKKLLSYLLVAVFALAVPLTAQNRTRFAGYIDAADYAFGVNPNVPSLINDSGPTTAGTSATLTIRVGQTTAGDGTLFSPFSSYPLIWFNIGGPGNFETVQATSVSCSTPNIQDSCTVTATFTYSHAQGERITSADYGIQEAANYMAGSAGGGRVIIDPYWTRLGGNNSTISTYTTPLPSVPIQDNRGVASVYWQASPSTTSLISAPTTLTGTTQTQAAACPTGASCTWTATQPFFCIAYVDILGQLSACSGSYQVGSALTASLPVNIAAPAASAGAVGWVAFAGTSALASFQLPVASNVGVANGACTLTNLESVIPACAVANATYNQAGSSASFNTLYSNTNMQAPLATNATANISNPVYQAHTAFLYQPTASAPQPFQTNFTTWPANTATQSATNIAVLGTVNLPIGYMNYIGRSIRITGKVAATVTTASTPEILILDGWQGAYSSGAPSKTLCTIPAVGTPTGTTDLVAFSCTITTTAVGTTAVGATTSNGTGVAQAGTALGIAMIDNGTATTVSSIGLFSSNQLFVEFINTATGSTAGQLIDLHVETLQ